MGRIFALKPSAWEADHAAAIVAGMHYQAEHDSLLPPTPMWKALERRHDLDPARFDRWHPNVGAMIEGCEHREAGLASLTTEPPAPRAAVAPEPSSLALGLAGSASLVVALVAAWAWAGRGETPEAARARHLRECELRRDHDPLL